MSELKVSFPEPCSEQWDSMSPRGCNRHCASCDTLVHDLTKLTADEVEQLVDKGKKICVRAEVGTDGRIRTADRSKKSVRPVMASAGLLLVAACQTTPGGSVNGGYTLSGQVFAHANSGKSEISNSAGDTAKLVIGRDGHFDVHGLRPDTYTLEILDYCGAKHQISDIAVIDDDVDLGRLNLSPSCIIVGQLVRHKEDGRA